MGNLLGAPVTEKETHRGSTRITTSDNNNNNNNNNNQIHYAVSSMQGWRVHMEDAHIAEGRLYAWIDNPAANHDDKIKLHLPGHALFAVFDGHGGSYAAKYAGRNLCRVLSCQEKFAEYAKLYTKTAPGNKAKIQQECQELLTGALLDAFCDCDREIACALKGTKVPRADEPYHDDDDEENNHNNTTTTANANPQQANAQPGDQNAAATPSPADAALQLLEDEGDSGTTACVILLTPELLLCANAGDSRAILRQVVEDTTTANTAAVGVNTTKPLSFDHKPDDESEERRIRAAGGYVAGGRVEGDLAVSRGLGDFRFKDLQIVMKGSDGGTGTSNGGAAPPPPLPAGPAPGAAPAVAITRAADQKVSPIPDILIHHRQVTRDAFFCIACDGIWDVQTNEHASKLICDLYQEGETDLGYMCEEVCDICLRLGSKDNMTVLIGQFPLASTHASLGGGNGNNGNNGSGGVLQRRQLRNQEASSATEPTAMMAPGGGGGGGGMMSS